MRDLSLNPRAEETRAERKVLLPLHFSLQEILRHYTDSIVTIEDQYNIAESMKKSGNIAACKMIWRSQIVLAEGLLDFYIHELSKYCLFQMFAGQWEKSEKYEKIMVPMIKVEEALNATESKEWFFEFLNNRFSREVYLAEETMRDQLNLIGIGFANTMELAFNEEKEPIVYGKKKVQELFKRRNEIAHQNDRSHASAEQSDITKEYVEEYIRTVDKIIKAIHKIAVMRYDAT